MEKQKKKNQDSLIKSVSMIVAIIAFMGGFIISGELKERIYKSKKTTSNNSSEDEVVSAAKSSSSSILGFDSNFVDSNNRYSLVLGTYAGNNDSYFTLQYGNSLNEVKLIRYTYDDENTQEYTLNFNENVVDVDLAAFASNPSLNAVVFLLDNGDIAYGLVDELASETPSYTTIDTLSNIVKFYHATSCDIENMCVETTLVQNTDKDIFDLYNYIVK